MTRSLGRDDEQKLGVNETDARPRVNIMTMTKHDDKQDRNVETGGGGEELTVGGGRCVEVERARSEPVVEVTVRIDEDVYGGDAARPTTGTTVPGRRSSAARAARR